MIMGKNLDRTFLANNIGTAYGIDYSAGLLAIRVRETVEFLNALADAELDAQQRKLDLMNVKYVISQTTIQSDRYTLKGSIGGRPPLIYEYTEFMERC
jgi:hypothetical protein